MTAQNGAGSPRAGYFFYGDELWLAEAALDGLRAGLLPDGEAAETFYLDETKWAAVLDAARTSPFLFSPRRLVVVRFPEPAAGPDKPPKPRKKPRRDDPGAALPEAVRAALQAYFSDPPPGTVLAILFPGGEKAGPGIVRFFKSLAGDNLEVREGAKLKPRELQAWIEARARTLGKTLEPDAARRLAEFTDGGLRRLANELDKLAVATAGRPRITAADVDALTVSVQRFQAYELVDGLMEGDVPRTLAVCERLLECGDKPTAVVGRLADFFRGLAWAKDRLAANAATPPEIFASLFPQIKKEWTGLYARKSGALFRLLDGLTDADLGRLLGDLVRIDRLLKSSDASPLAAIEGFLLAFLTSRRPRPASRPGG